MALETTDKVVAEVEVGTSTSMADAEKQGAGEGKVVSEVADIKNLYATVFLFNGYTITDGAIRLVVLLNLNALGFTPIQIALTFSLYELAGVLTNLFGGIFATRYGFKVTVFLGLGLQLVGLVLLILVETIFGELSEDTPDDTRTKVTVYVTLCQMLSGISKDLIKISCKSTPKLTTKEGADDALFRIVALVTAMKNSFKGGGMVLGAVMLEFAGYEAAVGVLIGIVLVIFVFPIIWMEWSLGKGSRKVAKFSWAVFKNTYNVNVLSGARFFLFGGRDSFFEIGLPIFIRSILTWPEYSVGILMGGYVIVYGYLQNSTTKIYKKRKVNDGDEAVEVAAKKSCLCIPSFSGPPSEKHVPNWAFATATQMFVWATVLYALYRKYVDENFSSTYQNALGAVLIVGLFCFAVFFAVNSAVHSYLIVLYADKNKTSMTVGFYYMANAMGRLVGTMLSGVIYQFTEEDFGIVSLRPSLVAAVDPKTNRVPEDVLELERKAALKLPGAGELVKGFVEGTSKVGAFVQLSRGVKAIVPLKFLADRFVEDVGKEFPPGKLVAGRVVTVDEKAQKVVLSLKASSVIGQQVAFDKLEVGQKLQGSVQALKEYGMFVRIDNADRLSGLVHLSELADEHVSDPSTKYAVGDRVRVVVISVDKEKRRLGFSTKPSRFQDEGEDDAEE
ncbi:rRNA biogenesis protein RRP5 (Ribosomal RNA-processing protein 5) (U3 small nucleolar RNA-associated protein RRP5) (U3 snoRNA-associated protein RRP5), partial [Durusdinium trenchii]